MVFGWVKRLKKGLSKSSDKISTGINTIIKGKKIDENVVDEFEELLISSDLGVKFSAEVAKKLKSKKLIDTSTDKIKTLIKEMLTEILKPLETKSKLFSPLHIILVVGVNGAGKTATVGKIANKFLLEKKKVGVVAADTFRAAAKEQLKIWADRTNSIFFSGKEFSDPAALCFESIQKAQDMGLNLLLIDTAGRLHNKKDLMDELSKIIRVIKKLDDNFPHEVALVLDGNIGQNSIKQAEIFKEICNINNIIITKLDGTAKGGVLVPIAQQLSIPISYIGIGEQKEDLLDFNADDFSKALLDIN